MQPPNAAEALTVEPPVHRGRHWLRFAIFAVLIVFAWFAWRHYASFDWLRFASTFEALRRNWLCLGIFVSLLSFLGRAIRWQVMMLPVRASFAGVASATYIGFSAVVLFGRAGELVRPYLIAKREQTPMAAQAGVWVLERLYDLFIILLLFGIGLSQARKLSANAGPQLGFVLHVGGWVAIACTLLAGTLLYVMARKPALCQRRLNEATAFLLAPQHARLAEHLDSFLAAIRPAGSFRIVSVSLALTVLEWSLILSGVYCYFRAFPPTDAFHILSIAAYFGFIAFGAIVQLPGIGGGMQIASVVVLTGLFRIPVEQATGFSLLIWAGTSLVVLPVGIPLACYEGLTLRKLRWIGKETRL